MPTAVATATAAAVPVASFFPTAVVVCKYYYNIYYHILVHFGIHVCKNSYGRICILERVDSEGCFPYYL